MTRDTVILEVREVNLDLLSFKKARDCLHGRLRELEGNPERCSMLKDWPAFKAIDNCLIMAIVRCEGLLDDYRRYLESLDLPDNVVNLETT